jgi:hypothetical protein
MDPRVRMGRRDMDGDTATMVSVSSHRLDRIVVINEGFHCWEESFPISWDRHDRVLL